MSDYEITATEDVPVTDMSQIEALPPDNEIRDLDSALSAEDVKLKLWYFEPGDEIQYHAHGEQEEIFYVIDGEFSVKIGRSGEEEIVEVGPGDWWRAGAMIGHGHRYQGDDTGVVLAIGAPSVEDPGRNPHEITDDEIDAAD